MAKGNALGVNVRVAGYAGVEPSVASDVGDLLLQEARALETTIVGLPVSRYSTDGDEGALRALLGSKYTSTNVVMNDIVSPEALVMATAKCRVVVTGSYHAAVFGLAQGVPAVCLTKSSYYDAKFSGLQALFPDTCFVIPLDAPDWAARLSATIPQAWHLSTIARVAARDTAVRLRDAGREAFAQFRIEVESSVR